MDADNGVGDAITSLSSKILRGTGEAGILSKGYLKETPFRDYLRTDEQLKALLYTHRTAPDPEGFAKSRVTLDQYRSITGVTTKRVLAVTGAATGNQVLEIPHEAIEGIATGEEGRLRTEGFVRIYARSKVLTVYDSSGADLDTVREYLVTAVRDAKHSELRTQLEQASDALRDGEYRSAYEHYVTAEKLRDELSDWEDMYDIEIAFPDQSCSLSVQKSKCLARLDYTECIERARAAEQAGAFETALAAYDTAISITEKMGSWRVDESVSTARSRVSYRRDAAQLLSETEEFTTATDDDETERNSSIEKIDSIIERIEEFLDSAPQESSFPEQEQLRERKSTLQESVASIEPNNTDAGDTARREKLVQTLQSLTAELDRMPKATEVDELTEYQQYDYYSTFGSWDAALRAAGIDKEQSLLDELERVAAKLDKEPTTPEFEAHSSYSSSLYSRHFGSWKDALERASLSATTEKTPSSDSSKTTATTSLAGNETTQTGQKQGPIGVDAATSESSTETTATADETGSQDSEATDEGYPTEDKLLSELRRLDDDIEGLVKGTDMKTEGAYSVNTYVEVFGSWDDALEEIGIDKRALLIEEFERLWAEFGEPPTTTMMNSSGEYSPTLYYDVFDSWADIRKEATPPADQEKDAESNDVATTGKANRETTTEENDEDNSMESGPSRAELLAELSRLAEDCEGVLKATDMQDQGEYRIQEYTTEFGSWDSALEEAGVDRKAQLINEIERVWTELGERPSTTEMNEHGRVSATTIKNYFKSWDAACDQARPTETTSYLSSIDGVETYETIPSDERLSNAYVAKVTWRIPNPDSRKDAKLRVEDVDGDQCWIYIWTKHDIDSEFPEGHWYALENLRGKIWTESGEEKKQLSSTKDTAVRNLGTEPDKETLRAEAVSRDFLAAEAAEESGATGPQINISVQDSESDELLAEIERVGEKIEEIPTRKQFERHGRKPMQAIEEAFGTWTKAIRAADFDGVSGENRDTGSTETSETAYTREGVLEEIERVGDQIGGVPTKKQFAARGNVPLRVIKEEFGMWGSAVREADVTENAGSDTTTDTTTSTGPSNGYSEAEIIEEIRDVARTVGWVPSSTDMKEHGDISLTTVRKHFETWTEAREAADVSDMSREKLKELQQDKVSKEAALSEIQKLHAEIGDTLTPADIVSFGEYDEEIYEDLFGSVGEAMREADVTE